MTLVRTIIRLGRETVETTAALAVMPFTPLVRPWHLRWGATDLEASAAMPGDDLLPGAHFTATRAITIAAPPEAVWPWITQVGFGRAGFYSYDLLDNLGRPSANHLNPRWTDPQIGDLAAPMAEPATSATSFRVRLVEPPHHLVWAKPDSTWSWQLTRLTGGATRLVTRLKVRYRPSPWLPLTVGLIELGDFVMMRRMLLNLRRRAEDAGSTAPVG